MRFARLANVLILSLLLAPGCGKKNAAGDPDQATPAPPAAAFGPTPTLDECREFGARLEAAIAAGDKAEMDKLFRITDLFERCISDQNFTAAEKRAILSGANGGADQISTMFLNNFKDGGTFTVLRVREVDGRPRVLVRLLGANGLNYHDYTLTRYPDGQVAVEDIYVYLTGEPLSLTIRRLLLNLMAERNRGLLARLSGDDQLYTKNMGDLSTLARLVREGKAKEAYAVYQKLPEKLKDTKLVLLLGLTAAQAVSDEDYAAEMERFRRTFPNDVTADLVSLDYFYLKKQYDASCECIDRLAARLGGDPYLLALKGNTLHEAGKREEAMDALDEALAEDPKLTEGYSIHVQIALKEKDHPEALTWLKRWVEVGQTILDLEVIAKEPLYAEFVKSPQYPALKTWLANRGER